MASRWRQVLAVVLAVFVVAAGVVVVVASGGGAESSGAPPTSRTTTEPTPTLSVDSGCRLGGGPVRLAGVPARVTARVDRAWERIDTWLAEHAPVTAASLRPPADDRLIAATQRAVGVPLPPELVASLRRHDGVGADLVGTAFTFREGMHPLSADGIVSEATVMCEVLESLGLDGLVGGWWHGRYVPVATDYGGDLLLLDGARLGRHYEAGDVAFDGGYADMLERTADALWTQDPLVVDGVLQWR